MLKTLAIFALALSMNVTAAPTRGKATVRKGRMTTTASVRGKQVRVTTRSKRGKPIDMKLNLGASCDANKLADVIAAEVGKQPRLFRGAGGRGTMHVGLGEEQVRQIEGALVAILSRGKHQVGRSGGFTRFGAVDMNLGRLPREGESKTIGGRGRDGSGPRTTVTSMPGGGVSVTRTEGGPGSVLDVLEVTFNPDGSSTMLRSLTFGTGENRVTISEGSDHDDQGNETGEFAKVAKGSGVVFDGIGTSSPPQKQQTGGGGGDDSGGDQSSEGGGGGDDGGEPTPSGGETGGDDQNEESGNAPTMTSEGGFHAPAFDLSDEFIGNVINWNRLGAAVTQPSPHEDGEGEPDERHSGKRTSPCGGLQEADFDPNPAYLRPNKQGWVTDPVPFLRGSSRSTRRGPR